MKINFRRAFFQIVTFSLALFSHELFAHSEHGKARYVAENGLDKGYCEQLLRPCQTIGYAVQQANKGDKVLIASGYYSIQSTEELFYLTSNIVPVLAGFNSFDHYQTQSPDVNPTFLSGVPTEMIAELRDKGFSIVADGKAQIDAQLLGEKLSAFQMLNKAQAEQNCSGGNAGGFPCNNIDLVAHIPLTSFSTRPGDGNDIWGHVDLNTGKEYAIIGVSNGATIFDLDDPANPVEVGTIRGSSSIWRDIKVYQYFDAPTNLWKAYAYVTIDSANDGVTIIDLNDLPNSVSLVERNTSVANAHNVYISNVDYSLNIKLDGVLPVLQLIGSNRFAGSFHSYSLSNPKSIQQLDNQSSFNGYTHDGASVLITDSRKDTDCVNGRENCSVFVDFNEHEMLLWDISDPADTQQLASIGYSDVSRVNQYIHSGWVTEDKRFVLLHDEFDEYRGGLNSTVRIFQIDDLRAPVQVGQWTGPTRAIDHNGFVRGNRYYMSNYERGMTVLDITDPANPLTVGYFDTFPTSDNPSFNGAWGVYPYLPSGLILVSDINSGLYILRDKTQSTLQGNLHFESSQISVEQGSDAVINVVRSDTSANSSSVSVGYEVLSGSAQIGSDFNETSGTLSWSGNESGIKSFSIPVAADPSGTEYRETFFVRLFDPRSGATLSVPSYLTVRVDGVANTGVIEFNSSAFAFAENSSTISLTVNREGGSDGAASVDYQLIDGSALAGIDYITKSGTLNWTDGDADSKIINITIINDNVVEDEEAFSVQLSAVSGSVLGSQTQIEITILDDESNLPPNVSVADDFEVNTGQTVTLTSNVSDPENDSLIFLWQQSAGTSVNIIDSDQAQASFIAPSAAGDIEFVLSVTDSKGAEASDNLVISVVAPDNTPASSSGSGGLGFNLILMLFILTGLNEVRIKIQSKN